MLGRDVLKALLADPAANAPEVNVALAEEGDLDALAALARCAGVMGDALAAISSRIDDEGRSVGTSPDAPPPDTRESRRHAWKGDDGEDVDPEKERLLADPIGVLDALLVRHPSTSASTLARIAERHAEDSDFVLHAALHPHAGREVQERAAMWSSRSPLHDRPWLGRLRPDETTLAAWIASDDVLLREAAAAVADGERLSALAADESRCVRRAVASRMDAAAFRSTLEGDPAPEVRARALSARGAEPAGDAWLLGAMVRGGILADETANALVRAGNALDVEGAALVGIVLPAKKVAQVIAGLDERAMQLEPGQGVAIGIACRAPEPGSKSAEEDLADVVEACVRALAKSGHGVSPVLTGKARLASWIAEVVARADLVAERSLVDAMAAGSVGCHGILLARWIAARDARTPGLVPRLARALLERAASTRKPTVPARFVAIAWDTPDLTDDEVVALSRVAAAPPMPMDRLARADSDAAVAAILEVDLDPSVRSPEALDRVVLAMRAPLAPSLRAALAVLPLDARRSRMVVQSLPTWRGEPSGRRIHRLLKSNVIALNAAGRGQAGSGIPPLWSSRDLPEGELAVALATGTLSATDIAERIAKGRPPLESGLFLGAGIEAAAMIGNKSLAPLVELCDKNARTNGALLAASILAGPGVRGRPRPIQAAIAQVAARAEKVGAAAMQSAVEALATIERRRPGALESATPGSPLARAVVGSALARAYHGIG